MADVIDGIPKELLDKLGQSALATVEESRRVSVALAIYLFLSREVSIGRAAELAGCGLVEFHHLLRSLDLPTVFYGSEELAEDLKTIDAMDRESRAGRGR